MTNQPDDAQLTAFALGELTDAEQAEVQQRIDADPATREAVEEIRRVAGILSKELQDEPAPHLTAVQKTAVETRAASAAATREGRAPGRRRWLRITVRAAAAVVLIGLGVAALWPTIFREPRSHRLSQTDPNGDGRHGPAPVGTPGARGKAPDLVGTPRPRPKSPPTTHPAMPGARPTPAPDPTTRPRAELHGTVDGPGRSTERRPPGERQADRTDEQ